ncbi:hypothetical protein MLE62_005277 [Klebsiella pneumoniae]|nr:hypothetical protein [Klebsiella pneumoniae]
MTITLQAVNELIASLESAGELSIREQKFLKLAKAFKQLAAENVALKGGPQGFFAYGSECGYEEFDTAEEATEFAEAEIADFRDQACDGWSDEVGSVVWGIVMQRASMTGLRPVTENDNVPSHIEEWCDYTLLPAVETPATDRIVAGIKADEEKAVLNDLLRHMDKINIENLSSPWELSSEVVAFVNSRLLREGADK